jgi:two-component system OmpR family response regulator
MHTKISILIVDDDAEITELLGEYLSRFNFEVHTACDADSMRAQLARHAVNLVVLDVMLPGTDGLTLSREIRERSQIPVIMLTARTTTFDRIMGLENGADDYMGKPFEPRELVARIHTVLRRSQGAKEVAPNVARSDVVCFDGWELHREERTLVSPTGLVVALSNAEFRLLNTFLQTPRRLFSRDQLMEQARGRAMDALERSIDLLVSRLRQKLADDPDEPSMIKTVRGAGYMFNVQSVQGRMAWRV